MADFLQPKHHHNRTTTTTTRTGLETAAWAARILFLFIGIASTAVLTARLAFPYFLSLLSSSSHLPKQLWTSLISCLAPPYLFITVHFIIMVIWKLHGNQRPEEQQDLPHPPPLPAHLDHTKPAAEDPQESEPNSCDITHTVVTTSSSDIIVASAVHNEKKSAEQQQQQQLPWPPPEIEIKEDMNYTHSSDPDSIDATWQAIMEGKSSPTKNALEKSDTWEKASKPTPLILTRAPAAAVIGGREFKKSDTFSEAKTATSKDEEVKKEMRKCQTFRESTRPAMAATGWRGRDVVVMGRDELFSKVEAFIKMNYDQMRIQRQESEQKKQHYVEMVNAAAY